MRLDVRSDKLEQAADGTYSTAIWINTLGRWQGGFPLTALITVVHDADGVEVVPQSPVDLHDGYAEWPLTKLVAGHHYTVHVTTGGRDARLLITVPKLPAPNVLVADQNNAAAKAYAATEALNKAKIAASPETVELEKQISMLTLMATAAEKQKLIRDNAPKAAEPVSPDKLTVSVTGVDGDYKLCIVVLAKEGKPLVGFKGKVIVSGAVKAFTTKIGGLAVCPVKFKEATRYIEVHAGAQGWTATLVGP